MVSEAGKRSKETRVSFLLGVFPNCLKMEISLETRSLLDFSNTSTDYWGSDEAAAW